MQTMRFQGADGIALAADVDGPPDGLPVVLMHGGGQTRGSWKNGQAALSALGYRVIALDTRGHGESDWAADGDYSAEALAHDVRIVLTQLPPRPVLVGASMGGIAALAALGGDEQPDCRGLVLVDVTPRIDVTGAGRIRAFMSASPDGFETLEEVADAVAAFNPHRPRPKDISGLRRNLREIGGRLHWHWDPKFLGAREPEYEEVHRMLDTAARRVKIPTLLVRGKLSDIVGEDELAHFRSVMPHADYVDVAGAGHMIAGDRNDAFNAAIIEFLERVDA